MRNDLIINRASFGVLRTFRISAYSTSGREDEFAGVKGDTLRYM